MAQTIFFKHYVETFVEQFILSQLTVDLSLQGCDFPNLLTNFLCSHTNEMTINSRCDRFFSFDFKNKQKLACQCPSKGDSSRKLFFAYTSKK